MPEIDLARLRDLRRRADTLLQTLLSDLKPFRHDDEKKGFLRKPDSASDPDDVNVTTTCSCLMALALTRKIRDFYGESTDRTTSDILKNIVAAPWMSSGLPENNAFTTTLVIRTLGLLIDVDAVPASAADEPNGRVLGTPVRFDAPEHKEISDQH